MDTLDKHDVLTRPILELGKGDRKDYVKVQGEMGHNQFWHGDRCYLPVIYKGQRMRVRINPVSPHDIEGG